VVYISDEDCLAVATIQDSSQCSVDTATRDDDQASSVLNDTHDQSVINKSYTIDGLLLHLLF